MFSRIAGAALIAVLAAPGLVRGDGGGGGAAQELAGSKGQADSSMEASTKGGLKSVCMCTVDGGSDPAQARPVAPVQPKKTETRSNIDEHPEDYQGG
jgi:hypothetical protein